MTNEHDDLQLLFDYLVKEYMTQGATLIEAQDEAEKIIYENQSNLFGPNGLAYQLGEINFEFFCIYFLQDTFIPKENNAARELSKSHYKLWNTLSDMFIEDEFDKLTVIAPRGFAKTTVCDFALSMWLHCYKKSVYTLVCGRTEGDATEFIAQMRQNFEENKYIITAFGKLLDSSNFTVNKLELELTNKTKIQAISSTSSMRGKKYNGHRPSCIIADDYQGKADIITQEARDKKYKTWEEDSKFAGDKAVYRNGKKIKQATKFIVLGTILHSDCFMSRLATKNEYQKICYRVCDFDVDEYFNSGLWLEFKKIYFNHKLDDSVSEAKEFYYQHEEDMQYETIWPDKFECLDTAIDYFENPVAFKQELQNDAKNIGEKWFKSVRTIPREQIEEETFTKTMLLVDPASTSKKTSDYSAFLVGSTGENGFYYARFAELAKINARTDFDKYVDHMIDLLIEYDDITHIYIEKNTFNGADANLLEKKIKNHDLLKYRRLEIINESQRKNKDDKIATIIPVVTKGQIIFADEDEEFVNQILDFAGQKYSIHDDAPDITSEFCLRIDNIKRTSTLMFFDRQSLF